MKHRAKLCLHGDGVFADDVKVVNFHTEADAEALCNLLADIAHAHEAEDVAAEGVRGGRGAGVAVLEGGRV